MSYKDYINDPLFRNFCVYVDKLGYCYIRPVSVSLDFLTKNPDFPFTFYGSVYTDFCTVDFPHNSSDGRVSADEVVLRFEMTSGKSVHLYAEEDCNGHITVKNFDTMEVIR